MYYLVFFSSSTPHKKKPFFWPRDLSAEIFGFLTEIRPFFGLFSLIFRLFLEKRVFFDPFWLWALWFALPLSWLTGWQDVFYKRGAQSILPNGSRHLVLALFGFWKERFFPAFSSQKGQFPNRLCALFWADSCFLRKKTITLVIDLIYIFIR